ncbi:YqjF family protein [Alteribacillus sp. JSM 102045]|uniref:YqjF family protein n=1 Tax=Alteribacillus sp. JSM 102045 TaxID=1562101 RepID=UPI0035BFF691
MGEQKWIARQTWSDLLFVHWPVPLHQLRMHVPAAFEIETFDGQAWLSVVPFYGTNFHLRGTTAPLPFTNFAELNVRTYVTYKGEPGVYFLSLDANHSLVVGVARFMLSLPYRRAHMTKSSSGDWIHFLSRRSSKGFQPCSFFARYRPQGSPFQASSDDLAHWLTERYCLWTTRGIKVYKGPISHDPWQLRRAEAEIEMHGLVHDMHWRDTGTEPIFHYCPFKEVHYFPFVKQ